MIWLVLAACDVVGEPAGPFVEGSPPPRALALEVDGLPNPGEALTFTVTGAQPFEEVWIAMSDTREVDGTCPPNLGSTCFDLEDGQRVARGAADANGEVVLTYALTQAVPANKILWVQAGAVSGDSNGVARWRLGNGSNDPNDNPNPDSDSDSDSDFFQEHELYGGFVRDVRANVTNGVLTGTWRGFVKNGRLMTQCAFAADMFGDSLGSLPACPDCLFAFEVELTNFREVPSLGDCDDYWGVDPDGFPDSTVGLGVSNVRLQQYYQGYYRRLEWTEFDGGFWRTLGLLSYDYPYSGNSGLVQNYGRGDFRAVHQVTEDYSRVGGTNYY